MMTGTVQWTAQERVIHGKPAAEAVPAEIERIGAKRVLLLTTRSLTDSRLVREVTSALGDRCVGRFSEIHAHSPREAVIAGAALAREVEADHLLAVGGGSVTDATKVMLLALWRGVRDVDALSALAPERGSPPLKPLDSDRMRMTAVPTTLSAAEFTQRRGHHRHAAQGEAPLRPSADRARRRDTRSGGDARDADGADALDRDARDGSRGRALVLDPAASAVRRRSRCRRWGCSPRACRRSRRAPTIWSARLNCPDGGVAHAGRRHGARAERREPRHRLHPRRLRRHPARHHVVHLARRRRSNGTSPSMPSASGPSPRSSAAPAGAPATRCAIS